MTEDGARAYLSRARDGATSVFVRPFRVEAPLTCSGAAEPGSNVVEFRTKRGLAGCLVSGALDDAGRIAAVAVVRRGEAGVMVLAAGATDGIARGLASRVAESVQIGEPARGAQLQPLVRNEPRMVGCFEREMRVGGGEFPRALWTRCFHEDLTLSERFVIATSGGAAPEIRRSERQGTWACAAGTLAPLAPPRLSVPRKDAADAQAVRTSSGTVNPELRMCFLRLAMSLAPISL
jgi:hypothetical protein